MSDSQSSPLNRTTAVFMGMACLVSGSLLAGIGSGWVPHDPATVHAPPWVIVICGLIFVCAGLAVLNLAFSADRRVSPVFGIAILIGLTAVCNWVAFGPGERQFNASTSIGGATTDSHAVDERTGRVVFGASAIALDLVLLALLVNRLRKS